MSLDVAAFSGSATIGTSEVSLRTAGTSLGADTTVGQFRAVVDFNALASGDFFEFRVYEKARAADTQRRCFSAVIAGAQTEPVWISPEILLGAGWEITLKKVAGTDRLVSWSIRRDDAGLLATAASIAALNNLSAAQVNAEVDTALADYDGATHAEMTAELAASDDAVLAQLALVRGKTDSLSFGVAGAVDANITHVNEVAVAGDGDGTPWGPA